MRPKTFVGVMLAGVTLLAVSACGTPPGTDGDLTNQWPGMAAVTGWEPKPDTCHKDTSAISYRAAYNPVDCAADHFYETVHVGVFTDNAAKLSAPPAAGTVEFKAAWTECDAKATAFLGGEWRGGRIDLDVSLPSAGSWEGGARWFRCELSAQHDKGGVATWKKSLKGEFAAASELKFGCVNVAENPWRRDPVDCATPHNGEFVGVFAMPGSYEELNTNEAKVHQKCLSLIAGYVGVPDNGDMKYRTGTYYSSPGKAQWAAGDQSVRCYLFLNKNVSQSLKGTGTKGLPINYK